MTVQTYPRQTTSVGSGLTLTNGALTANLKTAYVTGNQDNITNTMANITDLTLPMLAATTYTGQIVLYCQNSTAGEGIKFDFDPTAGGVTATAFIAQTLVWDTALLKSAETTALATDITVSTITGAGLALIEFTIITNAAGNFIPRFSENSAHTSGTATILKGSSISINH